MSGNQDQFLEVIDRDEAERRFRSALAPRPLGTEVVPLEQAHDRILAAEVTAPVDVPAFDRSNFDGYAVRARDTFGAREELPRSLGLSREILATGVRPHTEVGEHSAITIATGGMVPRGADAIVMVEHADVDGDRLLVRRAVTPGFGIAFAGTDISAGEVVLRPGTWLTSRETGVLAAIGIAEVPVYRRPRVAILSTGDEVVAPGSLLRPGQVYDSNARILADAVRELGGLPLARGIVPDHEDRLRRELREALDQADVVLLSGGTSKGAGDISYRVVGELDDPGIVVHGVALKPGKPICLAASRGKPVVILPGFPTSAIFTFHEFVAPLLREYAARPSTPRATRQARLAVKIRSEIGRTEYVLVGLVPGGPPTADDGGTPRLSAFPMGKGSGSVTAFSRADGFITLARHEELLAAGTGVTVTLLGDSLQLADLVVIGSHCLGLDILFGRLQERGFSIKFLAVGSLPGLEAAKRGECDIAGIHLLDPLQGEYNRPFLTPELLLWEGYGREQGMVYRRGDPRFENRTVADALAQVLDDPTCLMVNRNAGSGTRALIDGLLAGAQPAGFANQPRSHNAVAAAVAQGRAEWGVAIRSAADQAGLGFLPLTQERYDFVLHRSRSERPAVRAFHEALHDPHVRRALSERGFHLT